MKVAFLIGSDNSSTRMAINAVCQVAEVKPVAILLDTAPISIFRRLKNLRGNIRRNGPIYLLNRILYTLHGILEQQAKRIINQREVNDLLLRAFSEYNFSVMDIGRRYDFPVYNVDNLNSSEAADLLSKSEADLGIVIGTRILKRSTFSVPLFGCINIHKGKVPEYRGLPPGFWELYDGAKSASVTVHHIDDGLDTGDIIGTSEIAIHHMETEKSLSTKLDLEGARLLGQCVSEVASGSASRIPQLKSDIRPKTKPTRLQRLELKQLSPHSIVEPKYFKQILKTLLYLGYYYLGVYSFTRFIRKKAGISRAMILLHHRVNDYSEDVLTTSTISFAEHIVLLKKFYNVQSTSWLVDRLERHELIPPDTVVIHFDDCYRGVFTQAATLLKAADLPATAFISSGYIGTSRNFDHDIKYPFTFENMSVIEVRGLLDRGFEIGAHTVNHVDLGAITLEQVEQEVLESRADLEKLIGQPVKFFSFPFGRPNNISEKAREIICNAGFKAMFSAWGGVVTSKCDLFDIPRGGASSDHRPLDIMMEIEGLSLHDLASYIKSWRSKW